MTDDERAAPPRESPRRVSPQRAFILALSPDWMIALRGDPAMSEPARQETVDAHAAELQAAQRAWALCLTAEHLIMGIEVLGDRRLLARAVCVVLRFALSRLRVETTPHLLEVLDVAEAWAKHQPVSDADLDAVILLANDPADRGPPGARALMALSIRCLADVLDPGEQVPGLAAVGAVDVAASAWFDAGLSDDYDTVRLAFADEVRRVIDPWPAFAAATKEVELWPEASGDDDIPF